MHNAASSMLINEFQMGFKYVIDDGKITIAVGARDCNCHN